MHLQRWFGIVIALLATLGAASTLSANTPSPQGDDLRAFDGEWIYVEDRTEGRLLEQLGPPMSSRFEMRSEGAALILVSGHGSRHRDVRVALDNSITEVSSGQQTARYRASWKDGVLQYEVDFVRTPGSEPDGLIRRRFRITPEGLVVQAWHRNVEEPPSVALYRHPEDIAMPTPARAAIGDLAWLAGAWVGTRSSGSTIEERWSPPLGGAMLGTSRTISRAKMSAFEFLRIVERDGGLVYVAQPGGGAPTEFVLSELSATRAVFDNPRHDYPKRIVYEVAEDGSLRATIGFMKGGTPRRFEWKREGS